jgi:hypothetical protein
MKFDNPDIKFWQTVGINHLRRPTGKELHEGEQSIQRLVEIVGDGTVRDVGCGYGRLAKFFNHEKYIGYDICKAAIQKAKKLFPLHNFSHWNFEPMVKATTSMFFNGPHLINHDEINDFLQLVCLDTNFVVIGEVMDPSWTGSFVFNEYRRSIEQYDIIFENLKFYRIETYIGEHERWKIPLTISKWEKR